MPNNNFSRVRKLTFWPRGQFFVQLSFNTKFNLHNLLNTNLLLLQLKATQRKLRFSSFF
jgi:hypothetical protein